MERHHWIGWFVGMCFALYVTTTSAPGIVSAFLIGLAFCTAGVAIAEFYVEKRP